jgi:hypothetical protein
MNSDTTKKTFTNSQNQPESATVHAGRTIPNRRPRSIGAAQPPRNMTVAIVDSRIMFAYSPRKKIAKVMPEYSTMWPATISDSPSTTSNGCRLVSAMLDTT